MKWYALAAIGAGLVLAGAGMVINSFFGARRSTVFALAIMAAVATLAGGAVLGFLVFDRI